MKRKIITSTLLVMCGLFIGCASSFTENKVSATTNKDYTTKIIEDRIMLVTYIDETNGNVVYISYDTAYMKGYRLEGVAMTSQPINNK